MCKGNFLLLCLSSGNILDDFRHREVEHRLCGWRDHFLVMSLGELCFVYEEIATDIVKVMAEIGGVPTRCPIADVRTVVRV